MNSMVKIFCLSVLTVGLFCAPVCQAEDLAAVALHRGKESRSQRILAFRLENLYWNVKNGSKEKSLEYSIVRYADKYEEDEYGQIVKKGTVAPGEEISGFLQVESPELRTIPKSTMISQQQGRTRQQTQPGYYTIQISCDESNSQTTARLFTISGFNPGEGKAQVDLALDKESVRSEEVTASNNNFVFCHIKNTSQDKTAFLHYRVCAKNPFTQEPHVIKEGQVAPGKQIYDAFYATYEEGIDIGGSLISPADYFIELLQGEQKAIGTATLSVLKPKKDGWDNPMPMFF